MLKSVLTLKVFTSLVAGLLISQASWAQVGTQAEGESTQTFPRPARITDESMWKPSVGAMAGFSNPEGSYNSAVEYGIDFNYQPYIPFMLGGEVTHASYSGEGVTAGVERIKALIKGAYALGGTIPVVRHSYLGLGAGPMFERHAGSDGFFLGIMPNAGFDIPLSQTAFENVSLGANARYLLTTSDAPDVLTVAGVVKYWF